MLGYAPKQKTMLIELNYYWDRGDNFFLGGEGFKDFSKPSNNNYYYNVTCQWWNTERQNACP